MISGHGTVATAVEATKLGAMDFIEKPLSTERVLLTVRNALNASRLEQENRRLRGAEDARYNIVGQSPALMQVLDAIGRAAPTNATVLVLGESGVGKELVARAIHRNSLRARERFVQVNCAAIPEELIESELFGHEKGSFTGATDKQIGKFELADRGTIFLDEVGDMSQKTQAKVLRVLQEGEVERIGSQRTLKVDVRVIAATNKDLEAAIGEGTFREDLYFRLSVIPVHVPPLRQRPEDIPLLVKHFAELFAEDGGRTRRFTPEALGVLQQHRWRGNIRELKNTVERVLIMARGDVVDVADVRQFLRVDGPPPASLSAPPPAPVVPAAPVALPPPVYDEPVAEATYNPAAIPPVAAAPVEAGRPTPPKPTTLREFKEQVEREFLVEKLREHGWNISRTAEVIDTPRSNLYKKLEQYEITQEKDG
jgi:two-component system nitrogen regulation response regulator NtrX